MLHVYKFFMYAYALNKFIVHTIILDTNLT